MIHIDGLRVGDQGMGAAIGVDAGGEKHPLALADGATENIAVVQALLADLVARGLDPSVARRFIIAGAKAGSRAIRNAFGARGLIPRCPVHKGRNISERLPDHLHAGGRRVLRQAGDDDDPGRAERVLRNLARRLELEAPGMAASVLEGLDEMLTVSRLGLPLSGAGRSPAPTSSRTCSARCGWCAAT